MSKSRPGNAPGGDAPPAPGLEPPDFVTQEPVRRILVALDASPSCRATADAAVELAERWRAEVVGLFVEDRRLLEIAALPLAAPSHGPEPSGPGASTLEASAPEAWSPEAIVRQWNVHAAGARRILEEAAARRGLRCAFEVVRGEVTPEILRRLPGADLLVLGRIGWSVGRSGRLGRTAASVLAASHGLLLPLGRTGRDVLRLVLR